jgi:hypothetical protein
MIAERADFTFRRLRLRLFLTAPIGVIAFFTQTVELLRRWQVLQQ